MNIPQSSIEPFGVLGMPRLQDYRTTVLRGLIQFGKAMSESWEYMIMRPHMMRTGFERRAMLLGATDVTVEFRDFPASEKHVYIVRMTLGNIRTGMPITVPAPPIV